MYFLVFLNKIITSILAIITELMNGNCNMTLLLNDQKYLYKITINSKITDKSNEVDTMHDVYI